MLSLRTNELELCNKHYKQQQLPNLLHGKT